MPRCPGPSAVLVGMLAAAGGAGAPAVEPKAGGPAVGQCHDVSAAALTAAPYDEASAQDRTLVCSSRTSS